MESKNVEYKREYTEDIKYAVVAFANTDGGKIYIGVDDDGHSCGVPEPDKVMLRVTNMIRPRCNSSRYNNVHRLQRFRNRGQYSDYRYRPSWNCSTVLSCQQRH